MPLIWKLLIFRYLKLICFGSIFFILISIIGSFQEIASLIAKKVPLSIVVKLSIYQIPYLLPIIIPCSCLMSSFHLFKQLSLNNQITFLRASGASCSLIILPLILVSLFFSLLNFYIISELSSICRSKTCEEIASLGLSTPKILLESIQKSKKEHVCIITKDISNKQFTDMIIIIKRSDSILDLCLLDQVISDTKNDSFSAENVTIISQTKTTNPEFYIENTKYIHAPNIISSLLIQNKRIKNQKDYLCWKELYNKAKMHTQQNNVKFFSKINNNIFLTEIIRRLGLSLFCTTCTFSGIVIGTAYSRFTKKNKSLLFILPILSISLLIITKNTNIFLYGFSFFILPQLISSIIFFILIIREKKGFL